MNPRHIPWLTMIVVAVLTLTACSSAPAVTPSAPPATPIPATATPIPATNTPQSAEPDPTTTSIPQLDTQSTFAVIAAIRAHILIVAEWADKDISPAERQAIMVPLMDYSFQPLLTLSDLYTPADPLAGQWHAAFRTSNGFYLTTMAWATGESPDEEFFPELEAESTAIQEILEEAVPIATSDGVDPAQYGPDYAGANEAAAALLPEITVEPLPESPTPGELNPALLPVQITPFVFDFAGSEVFFTIGTIENTSTVPQQNVEVEVAYFNFLDEHIGTVRGRLLADVASPGGVYPFIATDVVAGEEAALKNWTHYEVSAFSYPTSGESYQKFEIAIPTSNDLGGKYYLYGQITNIGDQPVGIQHIRIGAAAYDAAGALIAVGDGWVGPDGILSPGDSTPFSLIIQAYNGEPASYQFFAEVVGE